MAEEETLELFYQRKFDQKPQGLEKDLGHFNVFNLEGCYLPGRPPVQYSRRDFYKISLLRGHYVYHYGDKSLEVNGTSLIFFNPQIPYTFEKLSKEAIGYICIFKDAFLLSISGVA